MISSREDFLLLARNWMNASAKVGIAVAFGGEQSDNPLSTAFILKTSSARVAEIDESASDIVLSVGDDSLLSFGFDGATFNFGTAADMPPMLSYLLPAYSEVDEAMTVGLSSGLVVSFLTLKKS